MYQVLARKYRPRNFHELVGQSHVSRALSSALERGRLHHAYLFTGTRGVGKTTIARILAKCLNCEIGITATPCEVCATCRAVNEGRFIDLIEIDAASRTKVEDTRELLDNVPYAPTQGRFKVYLIDEVHMLSTHSFNALLKTLEEPPEHVKFLFATTDPQKLPITVISRCLQFTLRPLDINEIQQHLTSLLLKEQINANVDAIWQIAEAAQGSLRDALSLTDQAIAYGQGQIQAHDVKEMLGLLDRNMIYDLLLAVHANQQQQVSQLLLQMRQQALDVSLVLDQLIACLHELAMLQHLPDLALQHSADIQAKLKQLSQHIHAQDLQLYYQIACKGRADLAIAVTQQQGFEMCVLRLLAFKPLPNELTLTATVLHTSNVQSSLQPSQIEPDAHATQPPLATFAIQPQYSQSTTMAMAVKSEQKPYQVAVPIVPVARNTAASYDMHAVDDTIIASVIGDANNDVTGDVNHAFIADVMSNAINHVTEYSQTEHTKHHALSDEKLTAVTSTSTSLQSTEMALDFALDPHSPHLSVLDSVTARPPQGLMFDLPERPQNLAQNALQHGLVPNLMVHAANWLVFPPEQHTASDATSSSQALPMMEPCAATEKISVLESTEQVDQNQPILETNLQKNLQTKHIPHDIAQALSSQASAFQQTTFEETASQRASSPETFSQQVSCPELSPQQLLQTPHQDLTGQWTLQKWDFWIRSSGISPALQELAQNAEMTGEIEGASLLRIAPEYQNMLNSLQRLLEDALSSVWSTQQLRIEYVTPQSATPIILQQQRKHAAFERAEALLQQHPTIAALLKQFDGRLQNIQLK